MEPNEAGGEERKGNSPGKLWLQASARSRGPVSREGRGQASSGTLSRELGGHGVVLTGREGAPGQGLGGTGLGDLSAILVVELMGFEDRSGT